MLPFPSFFFASPIFTTTPHLRNHALIVFSPYQVEYGIVLVEEIVREEFVDELCKAMDEYYPVSSYADDGAVGGGGIGRGRRRDIFHVQGRFVAPTIPR